MSCDICDEIRTREFNNFVSEYVAALSNGSAAIFAGAGLSIAYFGHTRTLIPAASGQYNGIIRTAFR